jgi:hypothetical protein
VDHNVIDLFHATAAKSGFNTAGQPYGRVTQNLLYDTPSFRYPNPFHFRSDHQCVIVRSAAGPGIAAFSFFNRIKGNTCDSAGDISATVVSWGTHEVRSPTCIGGNSFVGSPRGSLRRYKAPQPRRGMRGCRLGRGR